MNRNREIEAIKLHIANQIRFIDIILRNPGNELLISLYEDEAMAFNNLLIWLEKQYPARKENPNEKSLWSGK